MFFSRECSVLRTQLPERLKNRITHAACQNVVSHLTFHSPQLLARQKLYGFKSKRPISSHKKLTPHVIVKNGMPCMHKRVNTSPKEKNYGKYLVFKSWNMIRAGKHTHADAMKNMFVFGNWACNRDDNATNWHAAMSAPNMVVSGTINTPFPDHIKDHWRCTHTSKFPGVAVQTSGGCTPELYKSGAFIIPGVTSVESLITAFEAIDDVLHNQRPPLNGKQNRSDSLTHVAGSLAAAHAIPKFSPGVFVAADHYSR